MQENGKAAIGRDSGGGREVVDLSRMAGNFAEEAAIG